MGESPRENVRRRRSVEEGPLKKVRRRRSAGEIPSEKVHQRMSAGEGSRRRRSAPRERVHKKKGMSMKEGQSERGLWPEKWL